MNVTLDGRANALKAELSDQIEITPEMIAAGIAAMPFTALSESGPLSEETLVSQVYRAMYKHAPVSR